LDLIVQNGLATKKLMVYKELDEIAEKEEAEMKGKKQNASTSKADR